MEKRSFVQGPSFTARLSLLDARFVGIYSRRLFIFEAATGNDEAIAAALEKGAQALVSEFPCLGGVVEKVTEKVNGQTGWRDIKDGPGVELIVKDVSASFDIAKLSARNFDPALLPDPVLVPVSNHVEKEPYPTCKLQLNLITSGAILAVCVAHLVADGPGDSEIIRRLADHCRAAQVPTSTSTDRGRPHVQPLGLDRTCYSGLKGSLNRIEDHPAYTMSAPPGPATVDTKPEGPVVSTYPSEPTSTLVPSNTPVHHVVTRVYGISENALQDLKTAATTVRISTNDAFSALIWRSLIVSRLASKVIDFSEKTESTFWVPVNTRRHMGLSEGFVGNAVYHTFARATLGELLTPDGLSIAAARIRAAINSVTKDRMAGHIEMVEKLPQLDMVKWRGLPKALTTDMICSSFYHSESMYTSEWGPAFGGRIVRLRPSDLGFLGVLPGANFIMPKEEGRGCEVQLSAESQGVAAMESDETFRRYFSLDSRR